MAKKSHFIPLSMEKTRNLTREKINEILKETLIEIAFNIKFEALPSHTIHSQQGRIMFNKGSKEHQDSPIPLGQIIEELKEGVVVFNNEPALSQIQVVFYNTAAHRILGEDSVLSFKAPLPLVFREPECMKWIKSGLADEYTLERKYIVLSLRRKLIEYLNVTYILITFEDITRRVRLEETRQKFISNMSHELRTPITSMSIALENLQEGGSDLFNQNIGILNRSVNRMQQLIEDLADLSTIENMANLKKEDLLDFNEFTSEILFEFKSRTSERGITLVSEIDSQLENIDIRTNKLRLYQMIHNLISNAFKYADPKSKVRLSFSLVSDRMVIQVQDEGPGIAIMEQEKIFERFYRTSSARGIPGTGLGLSIVKQLANKLGGAISLKSELGEGSTFTLSLPLN
jgi:signal transduction histidine kinase